MTRIMNPDKTKLARLANAASVSSGVDGARVRGGDVCLLPGCAEPELTAVPLREDVDVLGICGTGSGTQIEPVPPQPMQGLRT